MFELARLRADDARAAAYSRALRAELQAWRDARGGAGDFEVETLLTRADRAGPFGVVRVTLRDERAPAPVMQRQDDAVHAVLQGLRDRNLLPLSVRESVYFVPDTVIVAGNSVYLIKPQAVRLWLCRQALRDAALIVEATTAERPALASVAHG